MTGRHGTLVPAATLRDHLVDPEWCVVDCRFSLADSEAGRRDFGAAHIPGAVYAHLDDDLSGDIVPGVTGRHPLPPVAEFTRFLSRLGIGPDTQVVAYDDAGGAFAARMWWMCRWLGHENVAVLDGGWVAWLAAGYPLTSSIDMRPAAEFVPRVQHQLLASARDVETALDDPGSALVDARDPQRYRGDVEPIDPVAGHIPGAFNVPYKGNVDEKGDFRPADELQERYAEVSALKPIVYCGSGVTAAHDVLAMVHAGLPMPRLYAGSWSEWITVPERPVARQ